MSLLTDAFRVAGVFNSASFYGETPYVVRYPRDGYRDVWPSQWCVIARGQDLNEGRGHYRLQEWHGTGSRKGFSYSSRETVAQVREEAIQWARERFGIEDWARDPYGSYGPAEFVAARTAELKGLAASRA